jgi:hypothetical protein
MRPERWKLLALCLATFMVLPHTRSSTSTLRYARSATSGAGTPAFSDSATAAWRSSYGRVPAVRCGRCTLTPPRR